MQFVQNIKRILTNQQVLFWTFLVMLMLPNAFMLYTESTSLLTRIVNVVLPCAFYWLCMTFFNKPGKAFWALFIFIFFAAFDIVLLYLFGEGPVAVDMFLNVTTTNVTEVDELLSNLLVSVVFVFVVYGGGIALSIVSLRNPERLSHLFRSNQRKMALMLAVPALCLLGYNYATDRKFSLLDDIFPVNTGYNLILSVERYADALNYESSVRGFSFHAVSERADSVPEVYVLIIGETVRADNLGIYGYGRNTTPVLDSLAAQTAVYRDAVTMSNTTHKSVPLLLTAVASEAWDSLYCQRGIITAFKEVGYQTAFYSNQRRNHSFIDALGCEAHESVFVKDSVPMGQSVSDGELVKLVDKRLADYDGGKLLIVLHCYGSHFNYRDRYDRDDAVFLPDEIVSAEAIYRDELINAYDNTIHFTDHLVGEVIDRVRRLGVSAAVVFTSDHGEDIFDDSRGRFLHASPYPTYYQLRVPLVVWASDGFRTSHPGKWNALKAHVDVPVSTNLVVFHTLLHMGGIHVPQLRPELALSSDAFQAMKRLYVTDHNEYRPLDDCGLKPLDEEQFRRHGLQFP